MISLNSIKSSFYDLDRLMFINLGICLLCAIFFLSLGIYAFRKRKTRNFLFFLAFLCLFSTPFTIAYSSKKILFKTSILNNTSRPLVFSDSFLINLDIQNQGYKTINKCLISISPKRKSHHLRAKILDLIQPLEKTQTFFYQTIQKKEVKHFERILPYFMRQYHFKIDLDCR